jgi:hypothetical protein
MKNVKRYYFFLKFYVNNISGFLLHLDSGSTLTGICTLKIFNRCILECKDPTPTKKMVESDRICNTTVFIFALH